jgi:hypothetical protein
VSSSKQGGCATWTAPGVAVAIGVGLAVARPLTPHEAFAHLFIGCLLGAWLAGGDRAYLCTALLLSAVELFCFFTGV